MISELSPYTEYKKSGSSWLGAVPVHWEVRNLRTLISARTERDRPDLPLLSVAREKGVFVRSLTDIDENHNVIPEDLSNYRVARVGNLVINKMKAWQGSMGIAPCDGIVSPAYYVFDFKIANHAFGQRLLRSKPYVAHFGQASDGVRVGQWDLSIPGMRQIPVVVPPPDEQAAIVRFLDWANGRLEQAIRAKWKAITLLNERKQAIIHRAVTRGLDPSVPFKPSFVVGVGEIPKHWEERRLRTLTKEAITNGVGESAQEFREDWPRYVRITDIDNTFSLRDSTRASLPPTLGKKAVLRAGDLLIAAVGATFGKAYVHTQNEEACFAGYLVRVRPSQVLHPLFVGYWTESQHYWTQLRANVIQSTIQNFSAARVKRLLAVLPPIAEQAAIVAFVSEETSDLNILISRLEREIQLLREYRARLTADVVTGKLDVREVAAQLPEEVPLDAVEDAADLGEDLDTVDEEATA